MAASLSSERIFWLHFWQHLHITSTNAFAGIKFPPLFLYAKPFVLLCFCKFWAQLSRLQLLFLPINVFVAIFLLLQSEESEENYKSFLEPDFLLINRIEEPSDKQIVIVISLTHLDYNDIIFISLKPLTNWNNCL